MTWTELSRQPGTGVTTGIGYGLWHAELAIHLSCRSAYCRE